MNTSLQILLSIAVIIVAAKLAGALVGRMGLPVVLGELLAGVVLGPTVLNIWKLPVFIRPVGSTEVSTAEVFRVLAEIGVVLLMFVAGLETDTSMMKKTVSAAFWAAAGGVVLPMAAGAFLARKFGFSWPEAVFLGTILTATSVTITAQTLMNIGQLRSKAGSTILGAAVIDDILGLIVLSLVVAATQIAPGQDYSSRHLLIMVLKMAACLVTMFWFGPPAVRWILKRAGKMHGHHTEVASALSITFLLAFGAQWFGGMAAITGAYLSGLLVSMTSSQQTVSQELQPMINAFFAPIFFVSIGLEINARHIGNGVGFFVLLLLVAIVGKIVGCGVGALANGFSHRESWIVGVGMIPRGEVGLITASIGLAAGLVTRDVYMHVVMLVLITTLITPPLLRFLFSVESAEPVYADVAVPLEPLVASTTNLVDA
jgi:Kef-type K+ transport system membrane component KefB